jgi:hypothetical protein
VSREAPPGSVSAGGCNSPRRLDPGLRSSSSSQAHLTASAPFRVRARGPVSGRLSGTASGGLAFMSPVSRRLSAAGIRFSVIRFPPRNSALLTVGLPAHRPDPDGVTAFRTHELRPGWVPPIPRGRRCSSRTEGRAQPAPAASRRPVLSPCSGIPSAGLCFTRHQRGFKRFTRPVFPSPVAARMKRAALGLWPRASHPADQEPDDARQGGDRPSSTDLKQRSTASAEPSILRIHSLRATSRRTVHSKRRWHLGGDAPFDGEGSMSWVARALVLRCYCTVANAPAKKTSGSWMAEVRRSSTRPMTIE